MTTDNSREVPGENEQEHRDCILILGATPFAVPLIRKASSLGYRTIVCSNIPSDPGLAIADIPKNVSILDRPGLDDLMLQYKPVGVVCAASDLATLSIGYLNNKFGLCGIKEHQVQELSDKGRFVSLQMKLGLPTPESLIIDSETAPDEWPIEELGFPLIMKPFSSSGSRGVRVINSYEELSDYHDECRNASSARKGYVVQKFLRDYEEVGCEVFYENGKVVFLQTTNKFLNKRNVPTGHSVPGPVSAEISREIIEQVEVICRHLSIENTPVNIDIMVKPGRRPVIIDMSFRLGGNLLPEIMHLAYNTNPYSRVIAYACGTTIPNEINYEIKRVTGSIIFGSSEEITFTGELKNEIENLLSGEAKELVFDIEVNSKIQPFIQGNRRFGHALIQTDSQQEFSEIHSKIQRLINS